MKSENVLTQNCGMLDTVCDKLVEILKNLENILLHLDPLNNYEAKEESIFTNINDQQNEIIVLSSVIHHNINKLTVILHNFIKTIPPSYTYHTTFHYNSFVILREKKKKEQKRQDEKVEIENCQKGTTQNDKRVAIQHHDKEDTQCDEEMLVKDPTPKIKENENTSSINEQGIKSCSFSPCYQNKLNKKKSKLKEQDKDERVKEFFYFSLTVDLEYANLLYMKRYEEELEKYLINTRKL
ncbi:hypothetical protein, conserved [Plasmodium gonderi]|uniref:Uncharacterized protein n=1 Tax=Plasmodium gonderi TaxID=77519 RepID=A0A1Y1JGH3_PLAGO|nr:hypothetical protein, conserved [Plasmodium gonderi]GAW81621.1 hypothetical protein, conserved [Plasmodium gonderi]